jgi:quinol monooxygenase YgiN
MIIEWVGIVASPNDRGELGRVLHSLLGPIQVKPGCISCLIYQDWVDENVLYIESRWETLNDLIHYIRSDTYKRLLLLMELGVEPPTIEFLTVTEVNGLDFVEATRQVKDERILSS